MDKIAVFFDLGWGWGQLKFWWDREVWAEAMHEDCEQFYEGEEKVQLNRRDRQQKKC